MFKKKEKRYIMVHTYPDGDIFTSSPRTKERWEAGGFDKEKGVKYYEFEPERLQEVDLSLIIANK